MDLISGNLRWDEMPSPSGDDRSHVPLLIVIIYFPRLGVNYYF